MCEDGAQMGEWHGEFSVDHVLAPQVDGHLRLFSSLLLALTKLPLHVSSVQVGACIFLHPFKLLMDH